MENCSYVVDMNLTNSLWLSLSGTGKFCTSKKLQVHKYYAKVWFLI